jgi:hypothetical protein
MTDEQLSRDLQALEIDDEPNPAFADSLFTQLEDEVLAKRGPGATWYLLAAAALIAALAVGAALGSGLVPLPFLIAEASASPTPSATASVTAPESPSDEASPTPSVEPSPTPSGNLAVDGVASVLVNELTLRAEPGLEGERLGSLASGYAGFIVDGPVTTDGYAWYQLSALGLPPNSGCAGPLETDPLSCPVWFGWVAAADLDGTPWLEATSLVCPESPMNMETLALARGPYERLACNPDGSVTVRGWWPELPEGLGGACPGLDHPSGWLYCQNINYDSLLVDDTQDQGGLGLKINLDPDGGVTMPQRGQWIEIDGHFDDPAAQGCDEAAAMADDTDDPDQIVLACRAELVVESARPVNGPF